MAVLSHKPVFLIVVLLLLFLLLQTTQATKDTAAAGPNPPYALGGSPIWHPMNLSAQFVLFRSPLFALHQPLLSANLLVTAQQSPSLSRGTLQSKLFNSFKLFVNGILVSGGPGHNVPAYVTQAISNITLLPFLRVDGSPNVLAIECFFASNLSSGEEGVMPRLQAELMVESEPGVSVTVLTTNSSWFAFSGDLARAWSEGSNADGATNWYWVPNEMLDMRFWPHGWLEVDYGLDSRWISATVQPSYSALLYVEPALPPISLTRSACSVTLLSKNPDVYVLDYGQEIMGGINLTFFDESNPSAYSSGTIIQILMGEQLNPNGTVKDPANTGNDYNSTWTLSASPNDTNIIQHEFIQFRFVQIINSPITLTITNARAWVMQHPVGWSGKNPYAFACANEQPNSLTFGSMGASPPPAPVASFASGFAGVDATWNLSANTVLATTLDINVDSQTRQRDLCHVDALITGQGQYAVFTPWDYGIQRRTFLDAFGNDSGIWSSWYDFKASAALMPYQHALETGDLSVAETVWSNDDLSINADFPNDVSFLSAQFMAGIMYFNLSGSGLFSFPADCLGSWACDPLVDWPTETRDGYDCNPDNMEDTVRNSYAVLALEGLSRVAAWLNYPDSAERYSTMANTIVSSLRALLLRYEGDTAYFVDGAVGTSFSHAAIHSTLYAASVGVADNNATLATMLTNHLVQHDIYPSSCMTGKWWGVALYRLGIWEPAAADFAFEIYNRSTFPSWGFMIEIGATTTLEAWCWNSTCKWNTDGAHPWCSSPAFMIPRGLVGLSPLDLGWRRFQLAPQPSVISKLSTSLPTALGMVSIDLFALPGNVTVAFNVPEGGTCQVCLPLAGSAAAQRALLDVVQQDGLVVNGVDMASTAYGRMLCSETDLVSGAYVVSRITT